MLCFGAICSDYIGEYWTTFIFSFMRMDFYIICFFFIFLHGIHDDQLWQGFVRLSVLNFKKLFKILQPKLNVQILNPQHIMTFIFKYKQQNQQSQQLKINQNSKQIQQILMQQQRIVFTIPTLTKQLQLSQDIYNDIGIFEHALARASSFIQFQNKKRIIRQAMNEFQYLIQEQVNGEEERGRGGGLLEEDEIDSGVNGCFGVLNRRRLNLGEKVRGKLESTGNKSIQRFQNSSQSHLQSKSIATSEQHLYESSSNMSRMTPSYINEFNSQITSSQKSSYCSNQVQEPQKIPEPIHPSNSSPEPLNNISAKTQQSPVLQQFVLDGKDSPIEILIQSDVEDVQQAISRLKFQSSSQQHEKPLIKLTKVEEIDTQTLLQREQPASIDVVNVRMVSSRVIDKPDDAYYEPSIHESRYIPYQSKTEMPNLMPAYQYAMQQLEQLKQNVSQLQNSTITLLHVHQFNQFPQQSRSFIPSSISKPRSQKIEESFVQQLESNLKQILQINNKDESMLIQGQDEQMREQVAEFLGQLQNSSKIQVKEDQKYKTPNNNENYDYQNNSSLRSRSNTRNQRLFGQININTDIIVSSDGKRNMSMKKQGKKSIIQLLGIQNVIDS